MNDAAAVDGYGVLLRNLRVADQQATAYAVLRDRYFLRARLLDLTVLLLSTWLVAMTFVEPVIGDSLSPSFTSREIWIGLLSVGTFALSLIQLLVDWKGRAQKYGQSLATVSAFVRTYRVFANGNAATQGQLQTASDAYATVCEAIAPVPDSEFLRLKRRHKIKIAISQELDRHPGRGLIAAKLWILWRDNIAPFSKRPGVTRGEHE